MSALRAEYENLASLEKRLQEVARRLINQPKPNRPSHPPTSQPPPNQMNPPQQPYSAPPPPPPPQHAGGMYPQVNTPPGMYQSSTANNVPPPRVNQEYTSKPTPPTSSQPSSYAPNGNGSYNSQPYSSGPMSPHQMTTHMNPPKQHVPQMVPVSGPPPQLSSLNNGVSSNSMAPMQNSQPNQPPMSPHSMPQSNGAGRMMPTSGYPTPSAIKQGDMIPTGSPGVAPTMIPTPNTSSGLNAQAVMKNGVSVLRHTASRKDGPGGLEPISSVPVQTPSQMIPVDQPGPRAVTGENISVVKSQQQQPQVGEWILVLSSSFDV